MGTEAMVLKGRPTSSRTRHMHIRYFFDHDLQKRGEIKVVHCDTNNMIADFLTKPLQGEKFKRLRDMLMGHGIYVEQGAEQSLSSQGRVVRS